MYEPKPSLGRFQDEALSFMKERDYGALFLPMGTGKSFVVIEWIKWKLRSADYSILPILIVAPKTVCHTWSSELRKFGPDIKFVSAADGTPSTRRAAVEVATDLESDILIANYEYLLRLQTLGLMPQTVICDESTRIKNVKAKRSKAAYAIGRGAKHRWILTGSPVPRGMEDIYGQASFLSDGALGLGNSKWVFLNRYFYAIPLGNSRQRMWKINTSQIDAIRKKVAPHSFRRERRQCLRLPEKIYQTQFVDMAPKTKKLYKEAVDFWRINGRETDYALAVDLWLRILCLGFDNDWNSIDCLKYNALADLLDDIGDAQIVIWTNFRKENKRVLEVVEKVGRKPVAITGEVSHGDRETRLRAFEQGTVDTAVIGEQVGAFGLNELRDADYVIYFSNGYDLELRQQSEDRTYRAGRVRPCTYVDFLTRGSIEQHIHKVLAGKEQISAAFLSVRDYIIAQVEKEIGCGG